MSSLPSLPSIVITHEVINGKRFMIQTYGQTRVTWGKLADGTRAFRITSRFRDYGVPYDIARLAAGPDAWMRNLMAKCDCGANYRIGDADIPCCPECQHECEMENAGLRG